MVHWQCLKMFLLFAYCVQQICGINNDILPNIVLILTDDQDVTLNGLVPMNKVNNLIGLNGATFENAVCNINLYAYTYIVII